MKEKNVLIARYEDLLTDYDNESSRLVDFLKLDGSRPEIQKVTDHYRPGASDEQQGLHHLDVEHAVGPQADEAEFGVLEGHGFPRSPFQVGKLFCTYKVYINFKR